MDIDYNKIRKEVAQAVIEGRATYLPAGARDNATALVFIDGVEVAQASTIPEIYPDPHAGRFQEARLLPRDDYFASLRSN